MVSQIYDYKYCLAAHTAGGKMNGFSDEQLIEIRKGNVISDQKLHALAQMVKNITENKGEADDDILKSFFDAGYNKGNLVDIIVDW